MPYKLLMSWDQRQQRWRKTYRGQSYSVRCIELNLPESDWTQLGSREAANNWWNQKLVELLAIKSPEQIAFENHPTTLWIKGAMAETEFKTRQYAEVQKVLRINATEKTKSCAYWVSQFETIMKSDPDRGPKTIAEIMLYVNEFSTWFQSQRSIEEINEEIVRDYFSHVVNLKRARNKLKARWLTFKRFVNFVCMETKTAVPYNLNNKEMKIKARSKKVEPIDENEIAKIKDTLEKAPSRLRCFALLALNCGMQSTDIANLKKTDIKKGVLTRKRIKTEDCEGVPTVSYRLWDETIEAIKEHQSENKVLVFTNEDGKPLATNEMRDGKPVIHDCLTRSWQRHKDKGLVMFKELRRVGADLLGQKKEYQHLCQLFLGHSPKTIMDKHYVSAMIEQLAEATDWLREKILGKNVTVTNK